MKKFALFLAVLLSISTLHADSDHNNGNGNDDCILGLLCAGPAGPKGDKGDKGDTGQPGTPGSNGRDGAPGQDGREGTPGEDGRDGAPGQNGEQGPKGDKGNNGNDGKDGNNGQNGEKGDKGDKGDKGNKGVSGANGKDGKNFRARTQIIGEVGVRVFDTKRFQGQIFNAYDLRQGHNAQAGVRLLYKLGKSYEEQKIIAQERELVILRASLNSIQADVAKLKKYAHHPYTAQDLVFDPKHDDGDALFMKGGRGK